MRMNRLDHRWSYRRRLVPGAVCPRTVGHRAGSILPWSRQRRRARVPVRWITEQPFLIQPEGVTEGSQPPSGSRRLDPLP